MGKGTLTIYSASAGSGKTYTLAEIYLNNLFRSRYSYRRILAVTFTNKATAEMKSRILDNLHRLATGKDSPYLPGLIRSTGKEEEWIRQESGEILNTMLHDFSRFSISTIDSFFQKVLRAFTREAGLHSGFNVELDHSIILAAAVDEMLASAVTGTYLNRWLTKYALNNIEEDRSWNLRDNIIKLSEELFKEKYKILSANERSRLENKDFLLEYIDRLRSLVLTFEKRLRELGEKAAAIFSRFDLSDDMFYRKSQGVPGLVRSLASGNIRLPNSYVREINSNPPRWSTGSPDPRLRDAVENGLEAVMLAILNHFDNNLRDYSTAKAILANIYSLGILSDVLIKIHELTTSENSFLLSDAGEVLSLITGGDQAPFIYEKVGNRFENFMVDEFQDTSRIQWMNLAPLIDNSMAEGFDNLVVGDVKQSIYRWRNSDWKILGSELTERVDNDRFISIPLVKNWRSLANIVKFNNSLFTIVPASLDEQFSCDHGQISFGQIYSEAVQSVPDSKEGGYVRIEFIASDPVLKWQEKVLVLLPSIVESLQDKGYRASDIGIIVRDGKEGASVLKTFIDHSNSVSVEIRQKYNYNVVSGDSLLLSNSPAISFIISVLHVIDTPGDMISRALMLRYFLLANDVADPEKVSLSAGRLTETSAKYFPEGYEEFLERAKQMSIFEATENIIGFFGLGRSVPDVAYLNTFQDYVISFRGSRSGDLPSFLEWWETTGSGKSVALPGSQDAMRILTIHKSKGLEFEVVILPFLSWNLDHNASKQPFLWIKPDHEPFSEAGAVPVRYGSDLADTWFSSDYADERQSVYVDNINLLYVALTRACKIIHAFAPDNSKGDRTVAGLLRNALDSGLKDTADNCVDISRYFDNRTGVFEFGSIPVKQKKTGKAPGFSAGEYSVSQAIRSLKLKLHGENYFLAGQEARREKINYGRLMHEIFEGIRIPGDSVTQLQGMVMEGKITEREAMNLQQKIDKLLMTHEAAEWFLPENEILTETGILLPNGELRRPDRVILRGGKATVIDFKFGNESPHYAYQVRQYKNLLSGMGYENVEGFIWYVDDNKIVPA